MTKEPGKVIFSFGTVQPDVEGRVFILSDPDFEKKRHRIDVAEVYIEAKSADKRLFERFISYIINYPPKFGLQSVQIFYKGHLEDLGQNLKNILKNHFEQIQ